MLELVKWKFTINRGLHYFAECHKNVPQLLDKTCRVLPGILCQGSDKMYSIEISGMKPKDAMVIALLRVAFNHPAWIGADLQYANIFRSHVLEKSTTQEGTGPEFSRTCQNLQPSK